MNKSVNPTVRLVFGIIFIVVAVFALFQSLTVSAAYSLANSEDGTTAGAAGLVFSILMLVIGIIFIAARKNNSRGFKTATYIMCVIGFLLALGAMDEFSDMIIYAILLVAGVFFSNRTTRIKDSNNNNKPQMPNINSSNNDSTDEILKFKKLLDEGAITQEEFDAKKKELLNL